MENENDKEVVVKQNDASSSNVSSDAVFLATSKKKDDIYAECRTECLFFDYTTHQSQQHWDEHTNDIPKLAM